ncbi:MAG: 1,4-dihydroxy-2-naphthoate octaprenyltransferase [Ignavibacteria bacterium]
MADTEQKQPNNLQIWLQAVRAFSFPATMIPCVLGVMMALLLSPDNSRWYLIPFIMISLLLIHAASNVISDYGDYKKGVDYEGSLGGSGVLVKKMLSPSQALKGSIVLYVLAILIGIPIIYERGEIILYFGLFGIFSGFFYTIKPFNFKYIALGDLTFFFIYGPAIVIGTFYALTGTYDSHVLYASFPVGMLVVGILHANNMRDIIHDKKANIKTMSTVFGQGFAKGEYLFLVAGAYVVVVALIIFRILSPWSLIVFLSLPPAIKNMSSIKGVKVEDPGKIAMLDVQTAQLTLMFGLLLSISVLISKFV